MAAADSNDIVTALKEDHESIEEHPAAVTSADDAGRPAAFRELTELLVRHEVAEEVAVYPALRKMPGGEPIAGARIAEQAEAESRLAPTHPHPSAPDTPPGNRLGGPVAALFDRVRDAVRHG